MPRVTGLTVCRWNCHMLVGQFVAFQPAWRADWRLAPGTGSVSVFAPVSCLLPLSALRVLPCCKFVFCRLACARWCSMLALLAGQPMRLFVFRR